MWIDCLTIEMPAGVAAIPVPAIRGVAEQWLSVAPPLSRFPISGLGHDQNSVFVVVDPAGTESKDRNQERTKHCVHVRTSSKARYAVEVGGVGRLVRIQRTEETFSRPISADMGPWYSVGRDAEGQIYALLEIDRLVADLESQKAEVA